MIECFRHKGLERFFLTGREDGIQPSHASRLQALLTALHQASVPADMGLPGWRLHPLAGRRHGYWSVTVNGNWRIIFRFTDTGGVTDVDYLDYH